MGETDIESLYVGGTHWSTTNVVAYASGAELTSDCLIYLSTMMTIKTEPLTAQAHVVR